MDRRLCANVIMNILFENTSPEENQFFKNAFTTKRRSFRRNASLLYRLRTKLRSIPKCKKVFQLMQEYPDDIFKSHFRMKRTTFKDLKRELGSFWNKSVTGRPGYTLEKCLYITLWKLSNNNNFREISDRFGIGLGSAYRIFIKTVRAICKLMKKYVKWPIMPEELVKVMEDFQNLRQNPFPFVVGCIDSTHIRIPAPEKDAVSYYNRKGQHTVILQGVCDSKFRFLDAFVGYPGSCHDANVFKNSPLGKALETGAIRLPSNSHLLGDSAYPLNKSLMVPFRDNGNLSPQQKRYNYVLSSTRVLIEQCFGILKKKFQVLDFIDVRDHTSVKFVVMACIVLHNFIVTNEKDVQHDLYEIQNALDGHDSSTDLSEEIMSANEEGRIKRDNLVMLFSA